MVSTPRTHFYRAPFLFFPLPTTRPLSIFIHYDDDDNDDDSFFLCVS